ncbi:hypothetical protein E4U43_006737 [Claviceps pusilla]|uniref:Heterokaryon incompatibility domain-containing protein n=1 Tax=Claviceps pusilla TaxID=123648 RepID=A0A9P7SZJ9_9HYPO|nr:hypothetical protein E4U43_006737 [Claviceps pusilla]
MAMILTPKTSTPNADDACDDEDDEDEERRRRRRRRRQDHYLAMKTLSRILSHRRLSEGGSERRDPEEGRQKGATSGPRSESGAVPECHQLPLSSVSGSDAVLARRRRALSHSIIDGGCVVVDARVDGSSDASRGRQGNDTAASHASSAARRLPRKPPAKICPRCAAIDFPCLLDWKPGQPRPWVQLSHVLRPLLSRPPSSPPPSPSPADDSDYPGVFCPRPEAPPRCPFCLFFRAMIGSIPTDDLIKFNPYLRIRQAFERLDGIGEKHELARSVVMEVTTQKKTLPWGYLLRATDDEDDDLFGYLAEGGKMAAIRGRQVPPMLNPSLPKCWLDFCRRNHSNSACAGPLIQQQQQQQQPIAELQLIDCIEKRVVVAAEDIPINDDSHDATEYLALSYAWPQTGMDSSAEAPFDIPALRLGPGRRLPDKVPSLFADAIAFTITMGFRYLWIDRFCLQVDAAARRQQIDVMGEIYSRASLTLIIAAEDDTLTGIVGLSTPREHQLSLRVNNALYTTSLVRPDVEVASSKWASRAWTLQEGLLSRRRLIFTPSQVYFQCRALHCYESLSLPLRLAPDWKLGRVFPAGDARPTQSGQVKHLIKAYMCRDLTNQDERLDAFKALLRLYERADAALAVQHFLGLPLFHPDDFVTTGVVSETDRLAVSLGWIVRDGSNTTATTATTTTPAPATYSSSSSTTTTTTLETAAAEPCCSRTATSFPSWTWLAWRLRRQKTTATPDNLFFSFNFVGDTSPLLQGVSAAPRMEISVGFANDPTVLSWEIDGDAISKKPKQAISFLRLETYCFDVTAFVDKATGAVCCLQEQEHQDTAAAALGRRNRRLVQDMVQAALPPILACSSSPSSSSSPPPSSSSSSAAAAPAAAPSLSLTADQSPHQTTTPPKQELPLLGVLISGRNWNGGGPGSPCQVTALICGRSEWKEDGPWVRLGALDMDCASFSVESSHGGISAVMHGMGTGQGGGGGEGEDEGHDRGCIPRDVPLRLRELDLY